MRLNVLATDYDGTIASGGYVSAATLDALERARDAGISLVLVTGRLLDDLADRFEPLDLFARVVAENGAVIHDPARSATTMLGGPPPDALLQALARSGVPVSTGHTTVTTGEVHQDQLLRAIGDLALAWHVLANRSARTALPMEVTKATGLLRALTEIGATADRTVGVGDAENDLAFLSVCGLAAAVSDALPCVREAADVITESGRGAGVVQLIDLWLAGELDAVAPKPKKHSDPV